MAAMDDSTAHPYDKLEPGVILDAVDAAGFACDGTMLALNSYENRVYQVGQESGEPLIVKFYRPQRWSDDAILEEHQFSFELAGQEIPVVAPLADAAGTSLFRYHDFRLAVFPRRGGRGPNLEDPDTRLWIGRFIGRIHAWGSTGAFEHRVSLTPQRLGHDSLSWLAEHDFIPAELEIAWTTLVADVMLQVDAIWNGLPQIHAIRTHGDCHPGNILWTDEGPHFVDFDDTVMAPAVQDLWMLLSGDRNEMQLQLADYMEGYQQFHDFDPLELNLIEALRTLRMINYSAWLARRWQDPAFPMNFPWFNTTRYWEDQILALREQLAVMQEAPLCLY